MLLILPLMLPLSVAGDSSKASEPPRQEVLVQDRSIVFPHIPSTVQQAHAEYSRVAPGMAQGLQDLERDLLPLIAADPKSLPAALKVRTNEAEAAKFFLEVVKGEEYGKLKSEAIRVWNDWQSFLVEAGLATASGKKPAELSAPQDPLAVNKRKMANHLDLQEGDWNERRDTRKPSTANLDEAAKRRLAMEAHMSDNALAKEQSELMDLCTDPKSGEFSAAAFKALMQGAIKTESRITTSLTLRVVADRKAPRLAEAWAPLMEHLRTCALKFADLDAPSSPYLSADIQPLKQLAKLRFLERCRQTLWLCQKVWSQMTSHPEPAPLKELRAQQGKNG